MRPIKPWGEINYRNGERNGVAPLASACWSLAVKGFEDFSQARDALEKTVQTTVKRLTD